MRPLPFILLSPGFQVVSFHKARSLRLFGLPFHVGNVPSRSHFVRRFRFLCLLCFLSSIVTGFTKSSLWWLLTLSGSGALVWFFRSCRRTLSPIARCHHFKKCNDCLSHFPHNRYRLSSSRLFSLIRLTDGSQWYTNRAAKRWAVGFVFAITSCWISQSLFWNLFWLIPNFSCCHLPNSSFSAALLRRRSSLQVFGVPSAG